MQNYDVVPDSPTNNWCTLNPINPNVGTSVTLAEGNLKATGSTNSYSGAVPSTYQVNSGKWYWEVYQNKEQSAGSNHYSFVGAATGENNRIHRDNNSQLPSISSGVSGWSWEGDGTIALIGTGTKAVSSVSAPVAGDVQGFAVDLDNGNVYFYLNGEAQNSGSAVITGVTGLETNPMVAVYNTSAVTFNFGQDDSFAGTVTPGGHTDENDRGSFRHPVPSGFLSLCTANLPEPDISPADGEEPADYFDIQLWTGTGSGQSFSNWSFQPDFLWFKHRNGASDHALFDVVRGVNKGLKSNANVAEITSTASQDLVSFDSDGFTTGTPQNFGSLGSNNNTIATWGWKAGGTAVSNTDGDTTVNVSANKEAGFSIISGTSPSSYVAFTYGHGLDATPEFIIYKERSGTANWQCWHTGLSSASNLIQLNKTTAEQSGSYWNTHTDSLVKVTASVSTTNSAGFISYVFHSVEGYSKVGSYTGNGSADGAFVHCGFRPAWLLVKNANDSSTNWYLWDNKRSETNVVDDHLRPAISNAEAVATGFDFLSNGFKARNTSNEWNGSGDTIIFIAFAEMPFKYAQAR